ncbi:MAG: UDP-N-acetylglucosamine 1-carboxyvinyltransferase [Clostridia bacterium]|nr:UDP-N-acetylglucosamine 1-carboxyvinyltransferase [Clostridia bacterium]
MEKLIVEGGRPLKGTVSISGAKNAAVAILPATVLINGKCTIENLPNISDINLCCEILKSIGAEINFLSQNSIEIDTSKINKTSIAPDITGKFRASYYFIGSLLSRFHKAQVGSPGGCNLGTRPIDQHIKGFEALGAVVDTEGGNITANGENLAGGNVYFDVVSVGATINIMLAATLCEGTTVIENAAKEPHVVDVANFLNTMGANIRGAGTDVIRVTGVKELKGGKTYSIVPDQIEAGTFMIAAAATKGDVTITNCITTHLSPISAKLEEMGVTVEENDDGDAIRVSCDKRTKKASIKTMPYPGFPTDMQPQFGVLLALSEGTGYITEGIWDSRFQYTNELNKMGANITVNGKTAVFEGVESLTGCQVASSDLRAGAALIIAGLAAKGTTEVLGIEHIDRGYEHIENKFNALGAKITREKI